MYRKNHERIARDVTQDSLEYANGGGAREFACKLKCRDKSRDSKNGTSDKAGEAFPQIVIHDAEICIGNFECGVQDKRYCRRDNDWEGFAHVADFLYRFLAQPSAGEKE